VDVQQLVRVTFEAWNNDDLDAWLELLHPDVVYHTSGIFPGLQPEYVGHAGIREFWRAMHEPWARLRIDLERLVELDAERSVIEFRFRGVGAESGAEVDLRFSNAAWLRGGLAVEIFAAPTVDEAIARLEA
jgi:ketosteroid isomerase-like protein